MKIEYYLLINLFLLILAIFIGLSIDDKDFDIVSFENKLDDVVAGKIPYLNENTTIGQFSRYYYSYKPISSSLVTSYIGGLCKWKTTLNYMIINYTISLN